MLPLAGPALLPPAGPERPVGWSGADFSRDGFSREGLSLLGFVSSRDAVDILHPVLCPNAPDSFWLPDKNGSACLLPSVARVWRLARLRLGR